MSGTRNVVALGLLLVVGGAVLACDIPAERECTRGESARIVSVYLHPGTPRPTCEEACAGTGTTPARACAWLPTDAGADAARDASADADADAGTRTNVGQTSDDRNALWPLVYCEWGDGLVCGLD